MLARFFSLLLVLLAAVPAAAQIDAPGNMPFVVVSTTYNAAATSIVLTTGHGARLTGTPPYNCAWFNAAAYPGGVDSSGTIDPNYEVVTVTARSTDTLTVTRAQEGTSASTKNTGGGTYVMSCGLTNKTFTDINLGKFNELSVDGGALAFDASLDRLTLGTMIGTPDQTSLAVSRAYTTQTPANMTEELRVRVDAAGGATYTAGRIGVSSHMGDHASVVNKTITNAANNGSGLIRITATGHGFATSDSINIYGVVGTTEANSNWVITVIDANTFDLQSSTFSNAYVSGGTATNRGLLYGVRVLVNPILDRVGMPTNGDDVNGVAVHNYGTGKATEAVYVANSGAVTGPGWYGVFSSPANADYGLLLTGEYSATSANTSLPGAGIWLRPNHTSNNTTTETQRGLYIRPYFNFGGSNTNKTVNLLDIDTENVSTTGLSALNLFKASYGGTQRFNLASTGNTRVTTSDAAATFTDNAGTSRSASFAVDNLATSLSATWQANAFLTHLDFASDPGTRVVNGLLSHLTTAADAIAQNSATYRGVNFIAQHNGSGALNILVGGNAQVTNSSTATVAQATGFGAVVQNTNASGTITTAYGVRVNDLSNSGTITTTYGLHIGDMTAGTQTNQAYSLYASDASARNFLNGATDLAGSVAYSGDDAASQITSNQNDYAISSTSAVTVVDADQIRVITGMTGGADGRIHTLINDGASDSILILRQEDTGSTAANRYAMAADVVLEPNRSAQFWYDSTASRWRLISNTATAGAMRDYLPFDYNDLLGTAGADTKEATEPWNYAVISSGTQVKVAGDGVRRGILRTLSSTTTNSGGVLSTDVTAYRLAGGETAEFIFDVDTLTTTTIRMGYLDTATSADAVDGAYIEIPSTGAAVCKTANNSTRTTSSTIATLSTATWYRARIEVDNTAANVTCTIFDANGNSLGSQTNSANIPTGAGRETGHGYVATNSGTTAVNLIQMDYLAVGTKRAVIR